jgi:hypothetical protein
MEKQKRVRRSRSEKPTELNVDDKPKRTRTRKTPVKEVVTEVVKMVEPVTEKSKVVKTPKKKDYTEFYKKYPHVVPGSVREPSAEDKKVLPKSHGMVCTIKCVDTGKLRVINTQDAFQVKRCEEAAVAFRKGNRNEDDTKLAAKSK